eukprot:Tbor_TRINITY_DN1735_c0_g1::TRINITY_DN1735_c0_g1_i1::g.21261::m.21261
MSGYQAHNKRSSLLSKHKAHLAAEYSLMGSEGTPNKRRERQALFRKKICQSSIGIQKISNKSRVPVRREISEHPLYGKLSELIRKESTLRGRLLCDRRALLKIDQSLVQLQSKLSGTQNTRSLLRVRLSKLEKTMENMKHTRTVQDLRLELELKAKRLNDLQRDYKAASNALKPVATRCGGARANLINTLESKRLVDEEALRDKYIRIKNRFDMSIKDLEAQRSLLLLENTYSPTVQEDGEIDMCKTQHVQLKMSEIDDLKGNTRILIEDLQRLQNEEKRMIQIVKERSDKLIDVNNTSEYKDIKQVTNLKENFVSKLNNLNIIKSRVTSLQEDISSTECEVRKTENAVKTIQHQIDEQHLLLEKLRIEIDTSTNSQKREAEDALLALKDEKAKVEADIKREKINLQNSKAEKQLITAKLLSAKKREEERNIAQRNLASNMLIKKEDLYTLEESLKDLKEKNSKDLEDAVFLTQKDSILSDLASSELRYSSKVREIDHSNSQLEKQLQSAIYLLEINNIELPF